MPIEVSDVFFETYGKYGDGDLDNAIIMEFKYWYDYLADFPTYNI